MGLELSRERKVGRASLNGRHTCACSSHEISNWPGRVPVRGQHSDRGDPCQSSNRTAHSKHLNFVGLPALRKCCTGHTYRSGRSSLCRWFHFGSMALIRCMTTGIPSRFPYRCIRFCGRVTCSTAAQEAGCGVGRTGRDLGLRQDETLRRDSCARLNVDSDLRLHVLSLALRRHSH